MAIEKAYHVVGINSNELQITGLGNSFLWGKAEVLTDFSSLWDSKYIKRIEFRSLWDVNNLYFYFKVYDLSPLFINQKILTKA